MAQHPWLDPNPFFFPGGRAGALLIHGFTGAPTEMRPLGEYLASSGHTVSGPLLPGHGTTVADLAGRKWREWSASVETAYEELTNRCDSVCVVGLSLGSLLAINLAADRKGSRPPAGLVLISPAIFVANPLMRLSWIAQWIPLTIPQDSAGSDLADPEADKRVWCYDAIPGRAVHQVNLLCRRVRGLLPTITVPTLVVMSRRDETLRFESGPYVMERISSADKEMVTLYHSGHNVLVDREREMVWERTAGFISKLTSSLPAPQPGLPREEIHR